jgi:hypothetical protein
MMFRGEKARHSQTDRHEAPEFVIQVGHEVNVVGAEGGGDVTHRYWAVG